jgi:serine protease Do
LTSDVLNKGLSQPVNNLRLLISQPCSFRVHRLKDQGLADDTFCPIASDQDRFSRGTHGFRLRAQECLQRRIEGTEEAGSVRLAEGRRTAFRHAELGTSGNLIVGQDVMAVGTPFGLARTMTLGVVSNNERTFYPERSRIDEYETGDFSNWIQMDTPIAPGNSGGPLVDLNGRVVGINTRGAQVQGLNFAIPIDIARPIMAQAVAGQPLSRPYMGIHFVSITRQIADAKKLPVQIGALVTWNDANGNPKSGVDPGTPAEKAGMKDGDIIVSVNGKVIDEEHPLDATLSQFSPGDTVTVKILRDGASMTLQVTLGTRPAGL